MSSRIEQIIEEIEEYIDKDCKFQPLSSTKIIVNKEHLDELLRELRMKTPDEIKRYQKIISNRHDHIDAARLSSDCSFNPKKQLRIPSNTVIPSEISTISASLSAIPSRSNAVGKTSFSCSHLPISFIISIVPLPYYLNLSIATYILPTFSERYNRKMDANLLF
jgi:hypothetical protein